MTKRVLITGGTGLIGRALATSLIYDGHEVIVLSRNPKRATGLPEDVRIESWDGISPVGWGHLVEDIDAIVHLAGENIGAGRWTIRRKGFMLESRLNAGYALVQAVKSAVKKPGVFIQASGIGYYGPRGEEEITEEIPAGMGYLARFALEWEKSTSEIEHLGVRRAIIRTGLVLSTRGGALPRMLLPFRLFAGGRLGNGWQWVPWIHIADEIRAIRFLIDNESARGPFNLAAPDPVTNRDFSRLMGHHLKRPSFLPVPSFLLRLLFGEKATLLLYGQRAVPKRLTQLGFTFRFPDTAPALQDILNKGEYDIKSFSLDEKGQNNDEKVNSTLQDVP